MDREPLNPERQRLVDTIYRAIEKCNEEIPLIKNSISAAQKKWAENVDGYFAGNVSLRLRLAIVDMSTLFISILTTDSEQTRNLNARLVSGQLYEFLEDVPKMFGKRYRRNFSKAPKFIKLDEQINAMMKSFNDTRSKYHSYLKEIRNNVASHRDDDGMNQASIIEAIEPFDIASIFMNITIWFFSDFLPYELRMIKVAEKLGFGPDLHK